VIDKRIEAQHVLRGVVGELRVNDLSARPAVWGTAAHIGTVDLMPFVVKGWNEVELWLRRDPALPEEERAATVELFASGSYREAPSGDDAFLAYQLTSHIAVDPPGEGVECVLRHRFHVPETRGTRLVERARPAPVDDALRGAVAGLRAAVRAKDLRAVHRLHGPLLRDEAEATGRSHEEVEEGWLAVWAQAFAAPELAVESSPDAAIVLQTTGAGRVHVARRADGRPDLVARWNEGRHAIGLSPAWAWIEAGWCVVR
jgi:hypothetical protein